LALFSFFGTRFQKKNKAGAVALFAPAFVGTINLSKTNSAVFFFPFLEKKKKKTCLSFLQKSLKIYFFWDFELKTIVKKLS
jgi:hypothetical protein